MRTSTGTPLRRRFTLAATRCGGSPELYLHKQQVILALFKTLGALETLLNREHPSSVQLIRGSRLVRGLAPVFMAFPIDNLQRPRGLAARQPCVSPPSKVEPRR